MTSKITDYHNFEIWRREDNAIEVHCHRDEFQLDPDTAVMEAETVARTLGEANQEANEILRIKVYDNGLSTTLTRDSVAGDKWGRFKWVTERTHSAMYSGVIAMPKPPEWFMRLLWGAEFAASKAILAWGRARGTWKESGDLAEFKPYNQPEENPPETLPETPESGVVVQFPGPRAT